GDDQRSVPADHCAVEVDVVLFGPGDRLAVGQVDLDQGVVAASAGPGDLPAGDREAAVVGDRLHPGQLAAGAGEERGQRVRVDPQVTVIIGLAQLAAVEPDLAATQVVVPE